MRNATTDRILRLLETATGDRIQAEKRWRSAIRDAIASNAPIEQVACVAGITIENLLATMNELYAGPSATQRATVASNGVIPR